MNISVHSRRSFLLASLLLVVITTACERGEEDESAEDPTTSVESSDRESEFELAFPRNDWECTPESVEKIDRWFEAMQPSFDVPRMSLRLYGQWADLANEILDEEDEFGAPATGPMRDSPILSGDEPLLMMNFFAERYRFRDNAQKTSEELRRELDIKERELRLLREEKPQIAALALGAQTPMKKVATLFLRLQERDFTQFLLLVDPSDDSEASAPDGVEPIPASLHQRFAEFQERTIRESLENDSGFLQPTSTDNALGEIIESCDEIQAIFSRIEHVAPHERLPVFTDQIGSAWYECGCDTDLEFLVTGILETRLDPPVATLSFTLSPDGTAVPFALDDSWQKMVDRLQDHHGEAVYFELRAADGAEPSDDDVVWGEIRFPLTVDGQRIDRPERDDEIDIEDLGIAEALASDTAEDSNLFGGIDDPSAENDDSEPEVHRGVGGMGMRGSVDGGGGTGYGRIGELREVDREIPDISMTAGPAEVDGELESSAVERVLNARKNALLFCYERELAADSELSGGELSFEWVIDADGSTRDITNSTNTTGNDDIPRCMERIIRRSRFASPDDGSSVNVNYPLRFE